jgi:hypothetical protein
MNETQHNGNERKIEQCAVAPVQLVGLEMMDQPELAAVEGGYNGTFIPLGVSGSGAFLV